MITVWKDSRKIFSKRKSHSCNERWLNVFLSILVFSVILLCTSCTSTRNFEEIDNKSKNGDFAGAYESLQEKQDQLYNATDKVLYALDSGMLAHYAGNYEESNRTLSEAEKLIDEYYATSISQSIGAFLLNDNVMDYAGEDFEDIYTNLFMALNYIHLGNQEGAFVEIRRFNNKLQLLSTKYTALLEQARTQTYEQGYNPDDFFSLGQSNQTIEFYDSAFARYVSLILYRSEGKMDSAEIDKKFIQTAFETQPNLYPFEIPKAVDEEFSIPSNKERLNVVCYTGLSPEKHEEIIRLPDVIADSWFKLALPVMKKNSSSVSSIHIKAIDENGSAYSGNLELIESVENIAIDTFQQKQGVIYFRALLRSLSKTATNATVTSVLANNVSGNLAMLFNFAADIFTEVSEQADIRTSKYFPSLIWVGGLNVDKGLYDVSVTCYDAYNEIVYEQITEDVVINENNVNLVEAVCLQ